MPSFPSVLWEATKAPHLTSMCVLVTGRIKNLSSASSSSPSSLSQNPLGWAVNSLPPPAESGVCPAAAWEGRTRQGVATVTPSPVSQHGGLLLSNGTDQQGQCCRAMQLESQARIQVWNVEKLGPIQAPMTVSYRINPLWDSYSRSLETVHMSPAALPQHECSSSTWCWIKEAWHKLIPFVWPHSWISKNSLKFKYNFLTAHGGMEELSRKATKQLP